MKAMLVALALLALAATAASTHTCGTCGGWQTPHLPPWQPHLPPLQPHLPPVHLPPWQPHLPPMQPHLPPVHLPPLQPHLPPVHLPPPPPQHCPARPPIIVDPIQPILGNCIEFLRHQCSPTTPTPYCSPQCQASRQQCCQQLRNVDPTHRYQAIYGVVLQAIMHQQPQGHVGGPLMSGQIAQQMLEMCGLHHQPGPCPCAGGVPY